MVLSKHYFGPTDTEADPSWREQLGFKKRYEALNPGIRLVWNNGRMGWDVQGKTIGKYRKPKIGIQEVEIVAEDVCEELEKLRITNK